jgi:molecular chaperone DnaK
MNEIKSAQEELSRTFSEAGQTFYAQSQSQPSGTPDGDAGAAGGTGPAGSTAQGGAPKEDVVEADYEIVDEGKK